MSDSGTIKLMARDIYTRGWVGNIDRFITKLAPGWGLSRLEARTRIEAATIYRAASKNRLHETWSPPADGDEWLSWELPVLRERSRDLVRNEPLAGGIITKLVTKVVGMGLTPQSLADENTVPGLSAERGEEWRASAESFWRRCAPFMDRTGRMSFGGMQRLVLRSMFENGDVFLVRQTVKPKTRPIGLGWAIVEADRISTPMGKLGEADVRNGIEFYKTGRPKGST